MRETHQPRGLRSGSVVPDGAEGRSDPPEAGVQAEVMFHVEQVLLCASAIAASSESNGPICGPLL